MDRKLVNWTYDSQLVMYYDIVKRCQQNIARIQNSLWSKIFKGMAQREMDSEYAFMTFMNDQIEDRIAKLESEYNVKIVRFSSLYNMRI